MDHERLDVRHAATPGLYDEAPTRDQIIARFGRAACTTTRPQAMLWEMRVRRALRPRRDTRSVGTGCDTEEVPSGTDVTRSIYA
ncbi:MAG TPA: hypothetical protein PKW63_12255 [Vicinamibacterales bacterium]|nr:hypothetical protein [Vicinamibacterales bacterium]